MAYLRSTVFFVIYFCSTVIYGCLSIFIFLLPFRYRHRFIASWTGIIVYAARIICGVRYRVSGLENLKLAEQPVVVLSKHQSAWETLFLQRLFFPAATVLKQELLSIPFFGWGLRALQPIAIDRSNPKMALKQVKTQGQDRIQRGYNVILFPEGTRIPAGQKGKYARSGADIAKDAGVNILPIAVNSGYCWPVGSFVKHAGVVDVVIGPPIAPQNKTSKELIGQVEQWIESTMSTLTRD
ncbi:MAG: 1-acyl-sn-glycerol-3-phosphate acyltransferase [Cellvibrionaceae bacterium]|nr:1-acyl-sn-glycerol-3-phosphate acyltransferase [Cellvibrionaceae bacterium]